MIVGVPREHYEHERRVALIPAHVPLLGKVGVQVVVETGAGVQAGYPDDEYGERGAGVVETRAGVLEAADVVVRVRGAGADPSNSCADIGAQREGSVLVGILEPYSGHESFAALRERKISAFALELLPRITKAQSMDVLSSMASVAGYKAALIAAERLGKMLPMLMTAAGTVVPSKVLVIGAGVAGLQAIATAHRLGAVVSAYDIRPAAREQVESLGAKFIALDLETAEAEAKGGYAKAMGEEFYRRQRELMADILRQADAVITTAAVPGKKGPVLITEEMVHGMAAGSLIVDLAAERGGNCECTRPGEEVVVEGVRVIGPLNLAAGVPYHASQLYSKNVTTFLQYLIRDDGLHIDVEDEIVKSTLVTHDGNLVHEQIASAIGNEA